MRILHTSDWHLGRLFHGSHLTEDQAHLLDQFVDLVDEARPDLVLIAGDIYDRAIPPPEAVELLSDTLGRIVLGHGVRVAAVAGNHDSPRRIDFGAQMLAKQRLNLFGCCSSEAGHLILGDDHGPVHIYALPYAEPALVRQEFGLDDCRDHDAALTVQLDAIQAAHPAGERSVLMAHAFVSGGVMSDSERPLSVGGAGEVDPTRFTGFDYVALGHLHCPQDIAGERIRYSGSLMKYSFNEIAHAKGVDLVEIDAQGGIKREQYHLIPRRDLRLLEGELEELTANPDKSHSVDDYLLVRLTDHGALLDAMGRLREVYPNVLHVERPEMLPGDVNETDAERHRQMGDAELFAAFFEQVGGAALTDDERTELQAQLADLERRDREAQV